MPIVKLKNPILINNKNITEITYDTNEITAQLYTEADSKKKIDAGNVTFSPSVEFDFGLHLYMGFAAAIAVNPDYTFEDLARVKGCDIHRFSNIGRRFLLELDTSKEENSESVSENTASLSTQVSQNSNENV